MKRPSWPHPGLSVVIASAWLLLQQSLALPQWVTAAVLAWGLPKLLEAFLRGRSPSSGSMSSPTPRPMSRRLAVAVTLAARVLRDVLQSNLAVARLVLRRGPAPEPIWIELPLRLRSPRGRAWLAAIVTMTPGTLSCEMEADASTWLVHALDGRAGALAIAADIQARYEAPLMEIFD